MDVCDPSLVLLDERGRGDTVGGDEVPDIDIDAVVLRIPTSLVPRPPAARKPPDSLGCRGRGSRPSSCASAQIRRAAWSGLPEFHKTWHTHPALSPAEKVVRHLVGQLSTPSNLTISMSTPASSYFLRKSLNRSSSGETPLPSASAEARWAACCSGVGGVRGPPSTVARAHRRRPLPAEYAIQPH